MQPKKVSFRDSLRAKKFVRALPKPNKANLAQIAADNSTKRFSDWSRTYSRNELVGKLREFRGFDRKGKWGVSFNNDLKSTNSALGIDLPSFIRKHALTGRVLEIGPGTGKTITQLQREVPSAKYSAVGLALSPAWVKHRNSKEIDWKVGHTENLLKLIPQGSCDIVFSSLGVTHAYTIEKALEQINLALKPNGHLVLNVMGYNANVPPHFEGFGFKIISSKDVVIPHSKKWFWQIWGQDRRAIAFHLQKTS